MKRGGIFLAAFVLVGGVLRFSAPPASSERNSTQAAQQTSKPAASANASGTSKPDASFKNSLSETITEFYGNLNPSPSPLSFATRDIGKSQNEPRFLIALVPDPLHTHLSVLFDRTVRSIQTAVQ